MKNWMKSDFIAFFAFLCVLTALFFAGLSIYDSKFKKKVQYPFQGPPSPQFEEEEPNVPYEELKVFCSDSASLNLRLRDKIGSFMSDSDVDEDTTKVLERMTNALDISTKKFQEGYNALDKYCPNDPACSAITLAVFYKVEKAQTIQDRVVVGLRNLAAAGLISEEVLSTQSKSYQEI